MRSLSMFIRLLIVSVAVILMCVVVLSVLAFTNLKNNSINSRMDALKTQARDISYLAGRLSLDSLSKTSGLSSATEDYINWKSRRIFEEYGAYTMVVDRNGKYYIYYLQDHQRDDYQRAAPTPSELNEYMDMALQGQEMVSQTQTDQGTFFTVMVPWV